MKKNTYYKPLSFAACFIILFSLPVFVSSQPYISFDTSLKNNSEFWKVKYDGKFSSSKPAHINFGPVRTIKVNVEKAKELNREVIMDLFWKNIKTIQSKESSMILTYNKSDTITVNMRTITEEKAQKIKLSGLIFNANNDQDETYNVNLVSGDMLIKLPNDTLYWRFLKTDSAQYSLDGSMGKLQSSTDSFFIYPVDNFSGRKVKDIWFTESAKGLVFLHEGKQVAALQLLVKRIWISKEINGPARQALLATIAAIFATIKSENRKL